MNNRTEAKLTDLIGMQKAIEEILKQAWERGRKYGQNESEAEKRKKTIRLIDADELKKALNIQMNLEDNCRDSVFEIIDNFPTVTPEKPTIFFPSGKQIILTDGHIEALCNYDRDQMAKETIERYMKGLGI